MFNRGGCRCEGVSTKKVSQSASRFPLPLLPSPPLYQSWTPSAASSALNPPNPWALTTSPSPPRALSPASLSCWSRGRPASWCCWWPTWRMQVCVCVCVWRVGEGGYVGKTLPIRSPHPTLFFFLPSNPPRPLRRHPHPPLPARRPPPTLLLSHPCHRPPPPGRGRRVGRLLCEVVPPRDRRRGGARRPLPRLVGRVLSAARAAGASPPCRLGRGRRGRPGAVVDGFEGAFVAGGGQRGRLDRLGGRVRRSGRRV